MSQSTTVSYPDRWAAPLGSLLIAHFLVHLGRDETVFEMWQYSWYYRDMLIVALIILSIWIFVGTVNRSLDRHYDWFVHPLPRVLLQLFLGWVGPGILGVLLCIPYWRFILHQNFADTAFFQYEFPVAMVFVLIINFLYIGYYFFSKYRMQQEAYRRLSLELEETTRKQAASFAAPANPAAGNRNVLLVSRGNQIIPLAIEQIAYLFKEKDLVFLRTFEGESYYLSEALDDLIEKLPSATFFRANRKMIVHFAACQSFKSIEYGKIELVLRPEFHEPVIVSQKRAPIFRSWVRQTS